MCDKELVERIDFRAAPSPTTGGWHHRYIGRATSDTPLAPVYQRLSAIANGYQLPEPVEFWCWSEGFPWCVNVDHVTRHGSVPLVDLGEVAGVTQTLDGFMQATRTEPDGLIRSVARTLKALEASQELRWYDASDQPANRFLRAHGFNQRGEPLKDARPIRRTREPSHR